MATTSTFKPRRAAKSIVVTGLTLGMLILFLSPFAFMVFTSLKTPEQIGVIGSPVWPAAVATFEYDGKERDMYTVPMNKCEGSEESTDQRGLALVKKGTRASTFIDPDDMERGEFVCQVSWRALDRPWTFAPTFSNYTEVWSSINFPRLLSNTLFYAVATTVGVLISCTLVAYGFSRFDFPGRDFLFVVLIATIFLPGFVTVIPTYTFFQRIGWVGTWLPLIVPSFFANAFDVFLLRQYFMTIPREMDEAAMIDGASRFRVLTSILVPQAYPVLLAVIVFHIVFAWNDYFGPLIYLSTNRAAWPVSVALSTFNGIYGQKPQLIQAGALMTLIIPLLLFIFAQRFFVQGIVITGVDK
ncbi:MAG TPA: carbohydrate ABC transporter permease [Anaerolineae bacterium]|nr:carbohydrate ABC transporter permease [Anaerolineae bacterium]HNU05931.1 carbohydrate ABC transporter permease [Anaerolineae bacterium]